jgi:hypothetical protein
MVRYLMMDVEDGQEQFLLRRSEWRGRGDAALFDLLTDAPR